ncbi:MAG: UDP-glucose--hexose-1-phosphate uridylyltransferase [Streptococcaceae bacterium]|jgi:UDPglucose--hexose-1-phosphate uridylyltransferase|nr:UDP-glucose--hexose-1-phosphate uridylyltransferase [Streptococcaceae bacterium]
MKISQAVHDFVQLAIKMETFALMDRVYLENRVLALIGEDSMQKISQTSSKDSLEILDILVDTARKNKKFETITQQEIFEAQLMDLLTPVPSQVNQTFHELAKEDSKQATNYFHNLGKQTNYIQTRAVKKNIHYLHETKYGEIEITINLSKPEKDPREIAKAKLIKENDYPICQLCMENEGYLGRMNHPDRSNHRIIRLNLNNEQWGFQYSPYAYFNEHSIILNTKHIPMKIDERTFRNLFAFVEQFPHYTVGSNADLPIVGGSILTHDHYQSGNHEFPMAKATIRKVIHLSDFPQIHAGILNWPMSVLRLQSEKKEDLVKASLFVLSKWKNYSDERVQIVAKTNDGIEHHTITPIVRRRNHLYEIDLVLRDNNVSDEHPDGIFHPHKEVQHIKQENIGLIEVMGLAILPPRLKTELREVENYLLENENTISPIHLSWAQEIKEKNEITSQNVRSIVEKNVGEKFLQVLSHAGVFKDTNEGHLSFERFIYFLNEANIK